MLTRKTQLVLPISGNDESGKGRGFPAFRNNNSSSEGETVKPPSSNTGGKWTNDLKLGFLNPGSNTIALDWFSASFPQEKGKVILEILEKECSTTFERKAKPSGFYSHQYISDLGSMLKIAFTPLSHEALQVMSVMGWSSAEYKAHIQSPVKTEMYISLSSSFIQYLGQERFLKLLDKFRKVIGEDFKPTRIDIAYDDYDKLITPGQVFEWIKQGKGCGFKQWNYVTGGDAKGRTGDTIYLGKRGSKGSGLLRRIYEKHIESNGKIDAIRHELEVTGRYVSDAWNVIQQYLDWGRNDEEKDFQMSGLVKALAGIIAGKHDFRERDDSGRLDRAKRLPLYEMFIQGLGSDSIKLSLQRVVKSFKKTVNWIKGQVATSVALLHAACERQGGGTGEFTEFIGSVVADGLERLSARHERILKDLDETPKLFRDALHPNISIA